MNPVQSTSPDDLRDGKKKQENPAKDWADRRQELARMFGQLLAKYWLRQQRDANADSSAVPPAQ